MKLIYDKEANAIYMKISNNKIKKTKLVKLNIVTIDLDKDDEITGIEFLFENIREINS